MLTTVDDFETQVLVGKNDRELIPTRLRAKGTDEDELLAGQAESGMRIIEHDQVALQPPGQEELDRTYAKLKQIHSEAYGWDPARCGRASSGCRPTACASTCGPGSTSGTCAGSTPPTSRRSSATGLAVDLSTDTDLEGPRRG